MPSLRDKLKATHAQNKHPAKPAKPAPQDCYVCETRFSFQNIRLALPDGILSLMQGDDSLPVRIDPERILFLDTETTGLSHGAGTVAFLVGVGFFRGHELIVRQYLMRDYDEEAFVLRHTLAHLKNSDLLCTFNGRSFDIPLLASRFIMQRMHFSSESIPHADLLHTARRIWKLRLRSCKLSLLEEHIYHEPRTDDLPGAEVPQRYFDYLKTKDFSLLDDILRHNAQDIATLARLLFTLSTLHENPLSAEHLQDIYSLGRVYEKRGLRETARLCYRAADAGTMSALCRERLAANFSRDRNPQAAARIYEKMIACRQGGALPYIALSKILEHRLHDIPSALQVTRKGLLMLSDCALSVSDQAAFNDLTHRYSRLLQKMNAQSIDKNTK